MKTIKTFLFSLGLVGGVALVGASGSANAGEIPDWAEQEVQRTFARYQSWKGDDTAVAVPFVTDVHSFKAEIDETDGFADSKRHIRILRRAGEVFGADATADLGDIGLDCMGVYTEPSSADHQATRIASQQALYADFTRPHLAVVGNHDHGAATNKITNAQFGDFFNNPGFVRSKDLVTGPNRDYGYYDVPGKNARLFFLNTTDTVAGNGYGISDDQVEFLRTHLAELKDGATAVIFSHYCLHQRLGRWDEPGWKPYNVKNIDNTIKVIEDFAARTDVHLAGVVAGDSHYDNHVVTNGVRWLISQGFGGCSADHLHSDPGHAVTTGFSRGKQTLIDVAAFKPATGEFRMFRIGAGGADRDVDFNDVFTWTGAAGDCRWSTAGNWETTSTTHAVPQSGDNVVAKVADNCTVTNDIPGLELPYLKLIVTKTVNTGTVYSYFRGEAITLTGGGRALSVGEEGVNGGSHRLYNYIPFYLPAGTNYFFCTPGRLHQYGKLSGPGAVRVAPGANYYSPSADHDYTGGTFFDGGRIDFSGNARCCMGDVTKEIAVDGETYFRLYSGMEIPYSFRLSNQDTRAVSGYTFYMEAKHTFTGAFRGDGLTVMFPSAQTLTLDGPVTLSGALRLPSACEGAKVPQAILNGRLSVGSLNRDVDASESYVGKNLDIYLNAADNAIGAIYVSAENLSAGAVNAFGTNAVIRPGVLDDAHGRFDCCGFDQTIDRFVLNPSNQVTGAGAGHAIVSTAKAGVNDGKATLTLAATDDCVTDMQFGSNLSLVWAPKVAGKSFSTSAAASRTMPMDGTIAVEGGTFTVNGGNSFPQAKVLRIADGATFVWASSSEGGLASVRKIVLGAGATLRLADGAAWPFDADAAVNGLTVDARTGSHIVLRTDDELLVHALTVDGKEVKPNATYSHAEVGVIENGRVTVSAPVVTWTGAAGGKWSVAANWTDDKGVARAPQSGDTIKINTLKSGETYENDIEGLSCPHIEFGGSASATYPKITGKKIVLTGGWNALSSASGRYTCAIPFELTVGPDGNPTNRFAYTGGRMQQDGVLSGLGLLYVEKPTYYTPNVACSYSGGTYLTGGTIDPSKAGCFGSGDVTVSDLAQFRFYSTAKMENTWRFVNQSGQADAWHNVHFWSSTTVNNVLGERVAFDLSPNQTLTVNGDVQVGKLILSMSGADHKVDMTAVDRTKFVFNKPIVAASLNPSFDGRTDGWALNRFTIVLKAANNAITNVYLQSAALNAGVKNAFGAVTVIHPGVQQTDGDIVDLCGFDQTIDRIVLNDKYPIDAQHPVGHIVTSSKGPAALTLSATEDCETDALFSGGLSLVWNPQGDSAFQTYAAFGREMPMTGRVVVSNGTFTVNGANSFPHASAVEVADGATFVWDSTVAGGLRNVASVKLGNGATLRVTATAAWPFETDADVAEACLDISSESVLDFRSGDTFVARRFTVDGVRKEPMTTYGHAEAAEIPEGAQVQVTVERATEADPRTWTGEASGTDVGLADNWSGTDAPSLYDGSLEPTFAAGGSLASVFTGVSMRNISFTGSNDFTLKGENDSAKLFLEGGIVAADRGTDATYALRLPVVLRSAQTWTVNGEKTKLVIGDEISGEGDVTLSGEGQLELNVGDACPWPGSLTSTASNITLKGELTSAEGKITYDGTKGRLFLSGAKVAKQIVIQQGGTKPLQAVGAADSAIGGLDLSGNTTISVEEGSKLTISGDVRLRAYCYPEGKGVFVFTNVNLLASAACQPNANSTIYIDYPGLPIKSYFDVRGRLYTRCPNALGLSQPQFYDGGVWDLCGYDQTCGRVSWISTYNADGSFATLKTTQTIRSDAPATLTVHHDNQSGSGSNKGPQVYAGKIVGQVSLVKTGYNYGDVQDLTIASEIASTGSVEVSWGLLSFTNAFTYKAVSLPGGRWPNCTRATAGRKVAVGGDVHYGTLELLHSKALGKKAEVYVAKGGAKVRLGANVNQRVAALYFEDDDGNWVKQQSGSWGSSASRAEHKDDERFEGPGLLLVGDMGMPIIVR